MATRSKEQLPDRKLPPAKDQAAEDAEEEQSPSVFFSLLVGSASVMGGFYMIRALEHRTKASLAPWVIARGTGLALVVVVTALVCVGLWMTHPKRKKSGGLLHPITLNSAHKTLAITGSVLLFMHITAIITDSFAKVGARGAFIPLMSNYRPIPVALGTLALYGVLAVGLTAWLKVRMKLFNWKMVHRYAIVTFALIMIHGITAGTDTAAVAALYGVATILVTVLAVTRYHFDHPVNRAAPRAPRPGAAASASTARERTTPGVPQESSRTSPAALRPSPPV